MSARGDASYRCSGLESPWVGADRLARARIRRRAPNGASAPGARFRRVRLRDVLEGPVASGVRSVETGATIEGAEATDG